MGVVCSTVDVVIMVQFCLCRCVNHVAVVELSCVVISGLVEGVTIILVL